MEDYAFFARKHELREIIARFVRESPMFATCIALSDSPGRVYRLDEVPILELEEYSPEINIPYLVKPSDAFIVNTIPQRKGGHKFSVSRVNNPDSWVVQFGGDFREFLVPSRISGDQNSTPASLANVFTCATEEFTRHNAFLVSPAAMELCKQGGRLIPSGNPNSPRDFDLIVV